MPLDNQGAPAPQPAAQPDGRWVRCPNTRCGGILVRDSISCSRPDKPSVLLAWGDRCPKCGKIVSVKLAPGCPEQVTLPMVERVYRATGISLFTWPELKTGEVAGFCNSPSASGQSSLYDPNEFIEPKGGL